MVEKIAEEEEMKLTNATETTETARFFGLHAEVAGGGSLRA